MSQVPFAWRPGVSGVSALAFGGGRTEERARVEDSDMVESAHKTSRAGHIYFLHILHALIILLRPQLDKGTETSIRDLSFGVSTVETCPPFPLHA